MFQLGSALLDGCVLAVLSHGDAYGYSLTQEIKNVISVSESTLYPVLRRLKKEGFLVTYDQAFNGRNRRYYQITESGRAHLLETISEWSQYKDAVDSIFEGGEPA
ncbi:MAG: PadR family transcriptional regulator [Coriobacteriia bacterium]|nr:PadR family transcriptional regulator [Coriobacteriia bacterium]